VVAAALLASLLGCFDRGSGGGAAAYPPDSAKAGEPIPVKFKVETYGHGKQAKLVKDISLEYRLVGQDRYILIRPVLPGTAKPKTSLPNYEVSTYMFTIPAYPKGTKADVEFFTNVTFGSWPNQQPGTKRIRIEEWKSCGSGKS
jgi:hypothetical protein